MNESKRVVHINPPPSDNKCNCCGKSMSELKPFGKAGDPLVGDFDGALLVKSFRTMAPHDENLDKLVEAVEDWEKFFESHPNRAKNLSFYDQLVSTVEASWECRDCIVLGEEEYFKIKFGGKNV